MDEKTGSRIGALLVLSGVVLTLVMALAVYGYNTLSPQGREIAEALLPDYITARLIVLYSGAIGISAAFLGLGGCVMAMALKRLVEALVIRNPEGVTPQIVGISRIVSPAETHGHEREFTAIFGGKLARAGGTGAAINAIRKPDDVMQLPPPVTVESELAPDEVIRPDFANRPVVGIAGQQGSGKSTLLYYIMQQYRKHAPNAEFVVMSTLPINWNPGTAITQPEDIYNAVKALDAEHQRRQQLAVDAGQHDWHRWAERPNEVVVIADELENAFDRMKAEGPKRSREFAATFRTLIKEGRNSGFAFVLASQTMDGDIVDGAFMASAGTLLLMRMTPATAARFYEYDRDLVKRNLPNLPPGRAWNSNRAAWVQFPYATQPEIKVSNIYRPRLALPSDAEADGLGPEDAPDGYVMPIPMDTYNRCTTVGTATTAVVGGYRPTVATVVRIENGRRPTAAEAAAMRAMFHEGTSKTAICQRAWGYKDGIVWGFLDDALEGRL